MSNNHNARFIASFFIRHSSFLDSFHSSKSWQRSGAVLSLRATTLALRISARERLERPSVKSVCSRALLSCTCQYTSRIPSSTPHRRLRRNCAHTGSCANQLIYDSLRNRPRWDLLRKVDYRFAESSCSLLQIVKRFCVRLFTNKRRLIV